MAIANSLAALRARQRALLLGLIRARLGMIGGSPFGAAPIGPYPGDGASPIGPYQPGGPGDPRAIGPYAIGPAPIGPAPPPIGAFPPIGRGPIQVPPGPIPGVPGPIAPPGVPPIGASPIGGSPIAPGPISSGGGGQNLGDVYDYWQRAGFVGQPRMPNL